jgi:ABC-2 type transport system ATP-binding protein
VIEARNLSKRYGQLQAVDGVSLTLKKGEAFGLLGPNGAGKTTLIHMLVGALVPDAGEVRVGGEPDPGRPSVRRRIGVAPQTLAIYEELTGGENLATFGRLYGLSGPALRERTDWALEFAGLTDRRRHLVKTYSGGMKRRLNLACALMHEPAVLVCDEPTVGVDPQSRNHVFESIERLRKDGLTLLYTTHYMEEAQRLCDRVAIMDHGRILAVDTVEALIQAHGGHSLVLAELGSPPPPGMELPGECHGTSLRIATERPFESVASLGKSGLDIRQLRVERPDLERVFLELTGRTLRDE